MTTFEHDGFELDDATPVPESKIVFPDDMEETNWDDVLEEDDEREEWE